MAAEVNDVAYDQRPSRPCVGCGKVDKSPRDQVALPDGNTAYYHMDCHVLIADCAVCKDVLKAAGGHGPEGKKNEELRDFLVGQADNPKAPKIFTTANASGDQNVTLAEGVN